MKSAFLVFTTLITTLSLITGCKKDASKAESTDASAAKTPAAAMVAKDPNEVIASVNDTKLLRKDMEQIVQSLIQMQKIPAEQMDDAQKYFEQRTAYSFIMKTLLLEEAKKQAVTVTDADRAEQLAKINTALKAQNKTVEQYLKEAPMGEENARKELEEGLTIDKLIQKNVLSAITIPQEEITKALAEIEKTNAELIEKNKNLLAANADKKAKITTLKAQLVAGADFAELAKANSDCPSGQNGGSLGEFTRGQMVKEFEDVAFTQEIGKVSDIVETQFGYHLIKVLARSPAQEATADAPAKPESATAAHILVKLDQAQEPKPLPSIEQLSEQLKQERSREAVQLYINQLKSAAKIETVFTDMPL